MQQYEAHQQHHQQQFPNQQWPGHEVGYGPDKRSSRAPADPENFADEGYGQDYKQDTFNQNFGSGQQSSGGGSSGSQADDGYAEEEAYEQGQQEDYYR